MVDATWQVRLAAEMVRKATSDAVIDGARRYFFEQRLKSTNETKSERVALEKQRKENDLAFKEQQAKKRLVARSVRDSLGKSKAQLATERSESAAALRVAKSSLRELHRSRMHEDYISRAATVKAVIANSIYAEGEAGSSPPRSPTGPSPRPSSPPSPPPTSSPNRTPNQQRRVSRDDAAPAEGDA